MDKLKKIAGHVWNFTVTAAVVTVALAAAGLGVFLIGVIARAGWALIVSGWNIFAW
jgi:hypothetical protein